MTDHQDQTPAAANEPVDCGEQAAKRAGAKHSSLKHDGNAAKPDVDKDDVSEADLDEALDESMDASDPPAAIQP